MSKATKQFTFRMDPTISDVIDYIAEKERRSKNDQMNKALEEWIQMYTLTNEGARKEIHDLGFRFDGDFVLGRLARLIKLVNKKIEP